MLRRSVLPRGTVKTRSTLRLTIAILVLIGAVALAIDTGVINPGLNPLVAGGALLIGCLAILVEATAREARARRSRG
jgi:hypothetical protein